MMRWAVPPFAQVKQEGGREGGWDEGRERGKEEGAWEGGRERGRKGGMEERGSVRREREMDRRREK